MQGAMRANPLSTGHAAAWNMCQQLLARHLSHAPGSSSRCSALRTAQPSALCASFSQHATVRSSWATDSNNKPVTVQQQMKRLWPPEKMDCFVAGMLQHIYVTGSSAGARGLLSVAILAAAKLAVPGEIQPWEFTVYQAEDWQREVSSIMLQLQKSYGLSMTVEVPDGHQSPTPWPVIQLKSSADGGQPLANIIIAATSATGIDSLAPRRQMHLDPVALEPNLNPAATNAKNTIRQYLVSFRQATSFVMPMNEAETLAAWKFLYYHAHVARGDWAALNAAIGNETIRDAWLNNKDKGGEQDRGCAKSALKLALLSIVNATQTPFIHGESAAAALGVLQFWLERLMHVMNNVGLVSSPGAGWRSWMLATDWSVRPYVMCSVDVLPDWQEQCDMIKDTLGECGSACTYQADELLALLLGCSTQQVKANSRAAWRDRVLQGMLRLGWVRSVASKCGGDCDGHADDDTQQWEVTGEYNGQEDLDTLRHLLHGVDKDFPYPRQA